MPDGSNLPMAIETGRAKGPVDVATARAGDEHASAMDSSRDRTEDRSRTISPRRFPDCPALDALVFGDCIAKRLSVQLKDVRIVPP